MSGPQLDRFDSSSFDRGRPAWVEALWWVAQRVFFSSWVPGSTHRAWLLRRFGARIGHGVVLKPGVRVKFPWRLVIADHVWIGEDVWIDNLATVTIRGHCCISQGAYLCTGSHDWESPRFNLITKPIEIHEFAWIGARAVVGPGVVVNEGAVLALGSVATQNLGSWQIYQGVPAQSVRARRRASDRSDGVDTGSLGR